MATTNSLFYLQGFMFLRINQRQNQSTNAYDEAVEVASNAAREYLPLLVVDDSSGKGRVEVQDRTDPERKIISQMERRSGRC